jgi:hypothetical protein
MLAKRRGDLTSAKAHDITATDSYLSQCDVVASCEPAKPTGQAHISWSSRWTPAAWQAALKYDVAFI